MSILNILILISLFVVVSYWKGESKEGKAEGILFLIISIEVIFVFRDTLVISGPASIFNIIRKQIKAEQILFLLALLLINFIKAFIKKYKLYQKVKLILIATILFLIIYVEYFNGAYSFSSIAKFQEYNIALKRYCYLMPFKLVNWSSVDYEGKVYIYYLDIMFGTDIRKEGGQLFYYKANGFGNGGYWFQFGIPEGQQVL